MGHRLCLGRRAIGAAASVVVVVAGFVFVVVAPAAFVLVAVEEAAFFFGTLEVGALDVVVVPGFEAVGLVEEEEADFAVFDLGSYPFFGGLPLHSS